MKAKGICSYSGAYIYKADGRIVATGTVSQSLLIQRSYSYRGSATNLRACYESQSLLIQRSYSYEDLLPLELENIIQVAIPSYSEVLFLQRN